MCARKFLSSIEHFCERSEQNENGQKFIHSIYHLCDVT